MNTELDKALERVRELERELAEVNHWRERHCKDAEAYGKQSHKNWEKARELEAQCAALKADAIEFAEGILEVCEFLDNSDHHYTKHTEDHIGRLNSTTAGYDLLKQLVDLKVQLDGEIEAKRAFEVLANTQTQQLADLKTQCQQLSGFKVEAPRMLDEIEQLKQQLSDYKAREVEADWLLLHSNDLPHPDGWFDRRDAFLNPPQK